MQALSISTPEVTVPGTKFSVASLSWRRSLIIKTPGCLCFSAVIIPGAVEVDVSLDIDENPNENPGEDPGEGPDENPNRAGFSNCERKKAVIASSTFGLFAITPFAVNSFTRALSNLTVILLISDSRNAAKVFTNPSYSFQVCTWYLRIFNNRSLRNEVDRKISYLGYLFRGLQYNFFIIVNVAFYNITCCYFFLARRSQRRQ